MKVIGITGGIGSGKSVVSRLLRVWGFPVYDSDSEARTLLNTCSDLKHQIIALLGEEAYLANQYNRVWIGQQVFGNKELLHRLNQIIHPAVATHFQKWREHQKSPLVFKESALLLTPKLRNQLDALIVVMAPEQVRLDRVLSRDGFRTAEQIKKVMAIQPDWEREVTAYDFLIHNEEKVFLTDQVRLFLERFQRSQNVRFIKKN